MSAREDSLTVSQLFTSAAKRISMKKRPMNVAFDDTKKVKVVLASDAEGNQYSYAEAVSHVTVNGEIVLVIYPAHERLDHDELVDA